MQPLVLGLVSFWFTLVAGALIVTGIQQPSMAHVPLFMLIGGACLVGLGRFAARGQEGQLIEFLKGSLSAREIANATDRK